MTRLAFWARRRHLRGHFIGPHCGPIQREGCDATAEKAFSPSIAQRKYHTLIFTLFSSSYIYISRPFCDDTVSDDLWLFCRTTSSFLAESLFSCTDLT